MFFNYHSFLPFIVAFSLFSYLIGSIPFGLLIGKIKGKDIRQFGSGNIGATNAGRVLGKQFFILVFALDFLKGFAPIFTLAHINLIEAPALLTLTSVIVGASAFIGHLFPIYLKFKGGKGVATACGVFSSITPIPTLIAFIVWCVIVLITKYVSLASIFAVIALNITFFVINKSALNADLPITIFCILAGLFVILKHKANIKRLFKGTENKI